MKYGLKERDVKNIFYAIKRFSEIETVFVFGSRAIGNYKKGSDVDIAIKGANITNNIVIKLSTILNEELALPYYFDVINYKTIENVNLKKHIDNIGKILYRKQETT